MPSNIAKNYDIVIAGAGLTGLLAGIRLRQTYPSAKILILEKEQSPGGRLRTPDETENFGSCGLHYISQDLFNFLNHTMLSSSKGEGDLSLPAAKLQKISILQGKLIETIPASAMFSAEMAKVLGGNSAARQWESFAPNFQNINETNAFLPLHKATTLNKKDPFLDVLSSMSLGLGIIDPWNATLKSFEDRSRYFAKGLYCGPWRDTLNNMIRWNELEIAPPGAIMDAFFEGGVWNLKTQHESVMAKALVVAQAPWEATSWLRRDHFPAGFIQLALKFSPISVLTLTLRFQEDLSLPQYILVPSERVQIHQLNAKELCLQVILDFETFLDAPRVVQAVKQVKRAKNKLCKQAELAQPINEFLGLRPVGWAQDTHYDGKKSLEGYDTKKINAAHLVFCGDAYGNSYDPDQNLIRSLLDACSALTIN